MVRRIDWNYDPLKAGRQRRPARRTESVTDMIRRNNGGFLASEISAGSAPGGQAVATPGPYMDTRFVGGRRWTPEGNGMSLRKHWVGGNVPVARDKNGRPIPMPADPSKFGGNAIGGFGTPGAAQGRQANGSPIPRALPKYMPYAVRFPGTRKWAENTFGKNAEDALDDAIGKIGGGASVEKTGKGATGVKITVPYSPMAVEPGASKPGNPWDVIRAGIHNQATQQAIGQLDPANAHGPVRPGDSGVLASPIDLADPGSVDKNTKMFEGMVAANKDKLAGQFVGNLTKSIRDDVDKNWKPVAPTATQTAEKDARAKVGTGSTPEERKDNLDAWNAARRAAHAEEAKRHDQSMKELGDMEKWIKDFAKQNGLKDPTQSAAKGGRTGVPSYDRGDLDSLISEMEA